jgi:hypothetical protein
MQTKIKNRTTKNVCGDHYSAWNNVFCLFSPTISLFSKFPTSSLSLTSIWLNLFEESGGQKRCNKVSFFHRGYTWNIYKLHTKGQHISAQLRFFKMAFKLYYTLCCLLWYSISFRVFDEPNSQQVENKKYSKNYFSISFSLSIFNYGCQLLVWIQIYLSDADMHMTHELMSLENCQSKGVPINVSLY